MCTGRQLQIDDAPARPQTGELIKAPAIRQRFRLPATAVKDHFNPTHVSIVRVAVHKTGYSAGPWYGGCIVVSIPVLVLVSAAAVIASITIVNRRKRWSWFRFLSQNV